MRHILLATALALAPLPPLAQAAPPPAFVLDTKADLFGYYMPQKEVRTGRFKLLMLAIGPRDDFRKFARGDRFGGTWAPVLLEFAPANAQQKQGEGGAYWVGSFRVLPTAYAVNASQVSFAGTDKKLGPVAFQATLDLAALKSEQKIGNGGSGKPVLRGTLTVGGKSYPGLTFTWFGGD